MKKVITPEVHGLIDYGLAAGNLVLPRLLRLPGATKGVFSAFAAVQGGLTAFTDLPVAVKKVVPFPLHGLIEKSSAPLFVIAARGQDAPEPEGARVLDRDRSRAGGRLQPHRLEGRGRVGRRTPRTGRGPAEGRRPRVQA